MARFKSVRSRNVTWSSRSSSSSRSSFSIYPYYILHNARTSVSDRLLHLTLPVDIPRKLAVCYARHKGYHHTRRREGLMKKSRPVAQMALLLLSVAGIGIALYLTFVHYQNVPLVCSAQGFVDCAFVLSSPYSVVPGTNVPITIPGLFWGIVSAAMAIAALRISSPSSPVLHKIHIAQFAWSLVGMLTVLYLVYVEIVKLHTICAWCTGMHALILIMFLITLVQVQQRPDVMAEDETETELEADRV